MEFTEAESNVGDLVAEYEQYQTAGITEDTGEAGGAGGEGGAEEALGDD